MAIWRRIKRKVSAWSFKDRLCPGRTVTLVSAGSRASTFHRVCCIGMGREIPVASMKLTASSVHVTPGSLTSGM